MLGLAVLLLRRLPTIFLLQRWIPDIRTMREAIFVGHFGPMGVGALFIATLAVERLPTPTYPPESHLDILSLTIKPIVYFLIMCSILVHGLSIPVFTNSKRLTRRINSISRTFTSGSQNPLEPSWLSRVRRAGDSEEPSRSNSNTEEDGFAEKDAEKVDNQDSSASTAVGSESSGDAEKHALAKEDKETASVKDGNADDADKPHREGERERKHGEGECWEEGDDVSTFSRYYFCFMPTYWLQIVYESEDGEDVHVQHKKHHPHAGMHMPHFGNKQSDSEADPSEKAGPSNAAASDRPLEDTQAHDYAESPQESPGLMRQISAKSAELVRKVSAMSNDDAPKVARRGSAVQFWKKRDDEAPRELTMKEKRQAALDEKIKREKHYCSKGEEVAWREGNRVSPSDGSGH